MLQIPNYAPKATFTLKRLNFTHNKGLGSAIKVEEKHIIFRFNQHTLHITQITRWVICDDNAFLSNKHPKSVRDQDYNLSFCDHTLKRDELLPTRTMMREEVT